MASGEIEADTGTGSVRSGAGETEADPVGPESFSLAAIVRQYARICPTSPMLTMGDRTISWGGHHTRSNQVGQALIEAGVGPEDRVAFIDKNGPEYFEVLFGGSKIRAVNVAVNWRLAPAEMAQIINDAQAKVLFVGQEFFSAVDAIASQLGTVTTIVALVSPGPERRASGWMEYESWVSAQPDVDPAASPGPADVAMQLYTSGTTGLPKGVMLTNANLGALIPEGARELGVDGSSVSMVAMPLFHIGGSGWSLLGLAYGAHSVIIRDIDPTEIFDAIARHRVSHTFVVPAVLMLLLAQPSCAQADFSSLEIVAYGASPITEKVLTASVELFKCGFVQLYGMTETTGAITLLRAAEHDPGGPHPERLRSCGVPFAHVRIRIVDPATGQDVPVGAVGELWTSSTQNMAGYWHDEAATAETIDSQGWLRTGDAGYLDPDGFVYLHDRVKDMIVSGGENIYPAEVENVLMSHPDVADVAVIGVPSPQWGETVKAIVIPVSDSSPDALDIISFCRAGLAHYKCPTSVDFVIELPRNPSGKLLKRQIRGPYWADYDRQIN
ncbi:MAG: long-chain-fatty-acid--CoA ligase [Acidimicrobiales bacterium]